MTRRTVSVKVNADISDFNRAMLAASASSKAFANSLDSSRNQMSGLIQAGLALGPALAPIGAQAIPAVTGLANQFGIATAAAGVTAIAMNGVGDALGHLNKYRIDPTSANLDNLTDAMAGLGPAGREFVVFLQGLRPELANLQNIAREGMFPGIQQGITELQANLPLLESFFATVSRTVGDLFAEAGDNLNDPRWQAFFEFLIREARPTLEAMGRTIGNFTEGLAQMWMAFEPLNDRFSAGFLEMSRSFADWAGGLSQSAGFAEFVAYIERSGPMVADALEAIGGAMVALAKATATVGEVALPILTLMANAFAGLMNSPIGPTLLGIAAGLAAVSTAMRIGRFMNIGALVTGLGVLRNLSPVIGSATRSWLAYDVAAGRAMGRQGPLTEATRRMAPALAKGAAAGGLLALSMSELDDKMGLTHTTSYALMGLLGGPWGAAIGAGIGAVMDLSAANDDLASAVARAGAAASNSSLSFAQQTAQIEAARAKMRQLESETPSFGGLDVLGGRDISLKGIGNAFKGLTGQSDTEKAAAGIAAAEAQMAATNRQKAVELGMASAYANGTQAIRDQIAAIYDKIAAKRAEVDATLSARGGEIAYEQAVDDATKTIRENGAELDLSKQAGRENVAALDSMIATWNALTPAGQKARGGIEAARKSFIKAAMDAGYSKKEAKKLADQLIDLEKIDPNIHVKLTGEKAVHNAIARINRALGSLSRKGGPLGMLFGWVNRAEGGIDLGGVQVFGAGGESHVPQIAPGGPVRVWAEPETKGEAYIPLANDWRRPRALDIWAQTGRHLGVQGFAAGGLMGRSASAGPISVTTDLAGVEISMDAAGVMRIVRGEVQTQIAMAGHESARRFQTTARGA